MRLAFLIPDPAFPEPWRWAFEAEAEALLAAGASVDPVPWTEAGDLSAYDLVLPLVTWGYHLRYRDWLDFLARAEADRIRMVNPPALLRWNSDKAYLAELGTKGVPAVPTIAAERCGDADLDRAREAFGIDALVAKPLISGGAWGTYRLGAGDPLPDDLREQRVILQPFVETIASVGEYSLILFDGVLSHAVVKRPKAGDFRVQPHLGGTTSPCDAPRGSEALAQAALAAAPAPATYARVDMIEGADGALMIMELELVEPALFLDQAPDGGRAFAAAILSAAERAAH